MLLSLHCLPTVLPKGQTRSPTINGRRSQGMSTQQLDTHGRPIPADARSGAVSLLWRFRASGWSRGCRPLRGGRVPNVDPAIKQPLSPVRPRQLAQASCGFLIAVQAYPKSLLRLLHEQLVFQGAALPAAPPKSVAVLGALPGYVRQRLLTALRA